MSTTPEPLLSRAPLKLVTELEVIHVEPHGESISTMLINVRAILIVIVTLISEGQPHSSSSGELPQTETIEEQMAVVVSFT